MDKFKTQYNGRVRRHTNIGSRIHETFVGGYDDKGRVVLKPSGKENIYDKIQSHKLSCDINYIVKQFTAGDTSVLSKVQGFYGDFTGMPTSYSQLLNTVEDGKRFFESLPVEARDIFGQNFSQFMESVVDGSVVTKIQEGMKKEDAKKDPIEDPQKQKEAD